MSVLPRIVDVLANQAIETFGLASAIAHPGESGRAREEVVRRFLAQIIPPEFGIDTGFVIDSVGEISRQIDIVIYRKSGCPILEVGGIKHFMVESVAAVIETKAQITDKGTLLSALNNIRSVKALDRTGDGRNRAVISRELVRNDQFQYQVYGLVVAGQSMKYMTCLETMLDFLEHNEKTLWPNSYVDIAEYVIRYLRSQDNGLPTLSVDPMTADHINGYVASKRTWGPSPSLAFAAIDLLDFLTATPEITFPRTSRPHSSGAGSSGYFYRTAIPHPDGGFNVPDEVITDQQNERPDQPGSSGDSVGGNAGAKN